MFSNSVTAALEAETLASEAWARAKNAEVQRSEAADVRKRFVHMQDWAETSPHTGSDASNARADASFRREAALRVREDASYAREEAIDAWQRVASRKEYADEARYWASYWRGWAADPRAQTYDAQAWEVAEVQTLADSVAAALEARARTHEAAAQAYNAAVQGDESDMRAYFEEYWASIWRAWASEARKDPAYARAHVSDVRARDVAEAWKRAVQAYETSVMAWIDVAQANDTAAAQDISDKVTIALEADVRMLKARAWAKEAAARMYDAAAARADTPSDIWELLIVAENMEYMAHVYRLEISRFDVENWDRIVVSNAEDAADVRERFLALRWGDGDVFDRANRHWSNQPAAEARKSASTWRVSTPATWDKEEAAQAWDIVAQLYESGGLAAPAWTEAVRAYDEARTRMRDVAAAQALARSVRDAFEADAQDQETLVRIRDAMVQAYEAEVRVRALEAEARVLKTEISKGALEPKPPRQAQEMDAQDGRLAQARLQVLQTRHNALEAQARVSDARMRASYWLEAASFHFDGRGYPLWAWRWFGAEADSLAKAYEAEAQAYDASAEAWSKASEAWNSVLTDT